MTDIPVAGLLTILLLFLSVVWIYPFIRPDIVGDRQYLIFKSGVFLVTGLILLGISAIDPELDLFLFLRLIAGFSLLYEGVVTVLKIHAMMKRTNTGRQAM